MTLTIRDAAVHREGTGARVNALLDEHADKLGLPFAPREIAFEAWQGETFVGGLTARMTQDWVFLALLAVSESVRGTGVGRALIRRLEDWAREQDATGIWLDTFAFQAPDFYQGLGYRIFGELPDSPAGSSRFFLAKRLDQAA